MLRMWVKFWRYEGKFTGVEYGIMGCLVGIYSLSFFTKI